MVARSPSSTGVLVELAEQRDGQATCPDGPSRQHPHPAIGNLRDPRGVVDYPTFFDHAIDRLADMIGLR